MGTKNKINITARKIFNWGQKIIFIIVGLLCFALPQPAAASYIPFDTSVNINVGIGTSTPQGALVVANGNVGIGTWTTAGGNLIVNGGGNVGIGSAWPGQVLDVQGTVRALGLSMSGQSPISGYILTATNSSGDTTWSTPGLVAGWTVSGNDVYETNSGNVGIGTSALQTALAVTNGNVGIGTWTAAGGNLIVNGGGNVGIGSAWPGQALDIQGTVRSTGYINTGGYTQIGTSPNSFSGTPTFSNATTSALFTGGNVGIGSTVPGQTLDVNGTVHTTGLAVSGQAPISGYILTASDSAGDTTWSTPGLVAGWTVSGNDVYETNSGNVGIGTTSITQGALVVTNGNVGIGTWTATNPLSIVGGVSIGSTTFANTLAPVNGLLVSGNVGIGSTAPGQSLDVLGTVRSTGFLTNGGYIQSGVSPNTLTGTTTFSSPVTSALFTGNVGISSTAPGQMLDIQGTVRAIGLAMSGEAPVSGYILTATDSSGDVTWSSPGGVSGWTIIGNNVYETSSGNVGIGTTTINQGALVVTNGNVGIGTWTTTNPLSIVGGASIGSTLYANTTAPVNGLLVSGNVGLGSVAPGTALDVQGTIRNLGEVVNGNVGIGTFASQTALAVTRGNVGIGTWTAAGGNLIVNGGGNVGIGSAWPGQMLDIQGTVRALGLAMSGEAPISGYVLTASDSSGNATWTSPGNVSGWTVSGNNVYETSSGNVGIGTTTINQGALVVTNGNVGIGTWTTTNPLSIVGGASIGSTLYANTTAPVNGLLVSGNVGLGSVAPGTALDVQGTIRNLGEVVNGNVGIGTFASQTALAVTRGNVGIGTWTAAGGNLIVNGGGNVGIGSAWPGQMLDIQGTVRALGLAMSGEAPISGYVLTASDSSGNATWTSPGNVSGWTVSGNNVYETSSGNVGIGTTTINQGALVVTNGNVGIGTWTTTNPLSIVGGASIGSTLYANTTAPVNGLLVSGNVGLGSVAPGTALDVQGTIRNLGEVVNGNVGIGTFASQTALAVTRGNVGIGTWTAAGGNLIVNGGGNVGIGSAWPGQALDVQGTVRSTGFLTNGGYIQSGVTPNTLTGTTTFSSPVTSALFTGNVGISSTAPGQMLDIQGTVRALGLAMSGQAPISGYVLTASDSSGDSTWTSPGNVSGWTVSGNNVYETSSGNVGIGTSTVTQGALVVTNGNVGIGTWTTAGGNLIVNGGGNVGIGSAWPGQMLDIQGTVRNLGEIVNGNVGIGTSASQTALAVTRGNVGIGTWTAAGGSLIVSTGNVGIGSAWPGQALDVQGTVRSTGFLTNGGYVQSGVSTNTLTGTTTFSSPVTSAVFTGNVGISSTAPGQMLDIQGTVRALGLAMSGQAPISGYVLTASDSSGDSTWTSPGNVSGWTVSGNNVYETSSGNVGIGTTTITQGALVVTNGNVGIGTWTTTNPLSIVGGASIGSTLFANTTAPVNGLLVSGNVGLGSVAPGTALDVQGTVRNLGEVVNGNVGIGTFASQTALAVTRGNVGIGTWTAAGGNLIVNGGGNVGIGSAWPGQALDVQGTVRSTGFLTNGGYVQSGVTPNTLTGTTTFSSPVTSALFTGNVGISSTAPGQMLDIQGTVRALGLAMSGQAPISGYVLTASDSSGDATWSSPGNVSGWTIIGNNVYETSSGNVGIGTTTISQGALVVTNGNVGIGTWAPENSLEVVNGNIGIGTAYNLIGIGTTSTILTLRSDTTSFYAGYQSGASTLAGNLRNSAVGYQTLNINTTGNFNTAMGYQVLASNTTGAGNTAMGAASLNSNTIGSFNTAMGLSALLANITGSDNSAVGYRGLRYLTGTFSDNTALGYQAGAYISDGATHLTSPSESTFIGDNTMAQVDGGTNETVIGYNAIGNGSNTVTLGNTAVVSTILEGNVGIGTFNTAGGNLIIKGGGNVGIGTLTPGKTLDVQGTVRDLGEIINGNVGIGTFAGQTALAVANGNVGIGTWTAAGGNLIVNGGGNVGIGSAWPGQALDVQGTVRSTGFLTNGGYVQSGVTPNTLTGTTTFSSPVTAAIFTGNVGISSTAPGQMLDIQGTVRALGFAMSGQSPVSGYILTASDSSGDASWASVAQISGWTTVGNDVYETSSGNVGIGTSTVNQGSLVVTNGNVGIGTWTTAGGSLIIRGGGNVGIGTAWPGQLLDVQGTVRNKGEIVNGNIGIGTFANQTALAVVNGNVGIGTWTAAGGNLIVNGGGNVGIGSAWPGQMLDIQGTVRALGLSMSGYAPISGYVLTASDSAGDATWSSPGGVSGWTIIGNNVYETSSGNVGIGTTTITQGALVVTNGNVGIGTWTTAGGNLIVNGGGNVGIGSAWPGQVLDVQGTVRSKGYINTGGYTQIGTSPNSFTGTPTFSNATTSALFTGGNVGISSIAPGQMLDIQGTVRALGLAMSGQSPILGYILTASDSAGDATWSSAGQISGWTISGNNVYETSSGNVGIGTTTINQGALVVTNGNVGIGTWTTTNPLSIVGGASIGSTLYANTIAPVNGLLVSGNVGLGSVAPGTALDVQGTLRALGEIVNGNVGIGTFASQTALAVTRGNVGIGTWTAAGGSLIVSTGNVGIGSAWPGQALDVQGTVRSTGFLTNGGYVQSGFSTNIFTGNVGISSSAPGQMIDVQGTVRALGLTMTGQSPISGYVLTASDSAGDTTWTPAGYFNGWTAVGNNVYETSSGNVGIGTTTITQGALVVTNGNVGIGTWTTAGGNLIVNGGGNVGIGSAWPGQALDVQGTIRSTGYIANGGYTQIGTSPNSFTGTPTFSNATFSALFTGGNVGIGSTAPGQLLDIQGTLRALGETINGNVGIGTYASQTALAVTRGNVGIGTWTAAGGSLIVSTGNVGIGSAWPGQALDVQGTVRSTGFLTNGGYVQSGTSTNTLTGVTTFTSNVGISSTAPGQMLDIQGTVRSIGLAVSGFAPISGYILTATDSSGDVTWSSPGGVSGWTISGNNVYETSSGNVGIGTTTINQGALVVTNGNVGIGTWTTTNPLSIVGGVSIGSTTFANTQAPINGLLVSGNVGLGSAAPGTALDVQGTLRALGEIVNGNVGIGTFASQTALAVTRGNVGIGTWTAAGGNLIVNGGGNVGIGSAWPGQALDVQGTVRSTGFLTNGGYVQSGVTPNTLTGVTTFTSNVGISSTAPGQMLDIQGTVRAMGLSMSGYAPISGYVLTASNSAGDATWTSPGGVSGWTILGNNVYETSSGNVGIGTTTINQGALVVTNGNVGIGTWTTAGGSLIVASGNVGVGSAWPGQMLDIQGTVRNLGEIVNGNVGIGTSASQTALAVTRGNVGIGTWTAAGGNLIVNGGGNVGIGSAWPGQALDVQGTVRSTGFLTNGGYIQSGVSPNTLSGLTTFSSAGTSAIFTGNVGLGSTVPGQTLDVNGTVRSTGFTMSGQSPIAGYILTTVDSAGDTTWSSAGGVGGWMTSGNNVYETSSGNVGIGTTTVNQGSLLVTNGNVGIGTWTTAGGTLIVASGNVGIGSAWPGQTVDVQGTLRSLGAIVNGNVGIGTSALQTAFAVANGNVGIGTWTAAGGNLIVNGGGNVGIGSAWPGQALDVKGTVRSTGFLTSGGYVQSGISPNTLTGTTTFTANVGISSTAPGQMLDIQGTVRSMGLAMSGFAPISGYVLTASDSAGDATWTSPGGVSGWTISGNNVYETSSGNVGIGTTTINQGALVVTNGNVGIGTWVPGLLLDVQGTVRSNSFLTTGGYTQIGTSPNSFTGTPTFSNATTSALFTGGNVGIGSTAPGQTLDVKGTVRASGLVMSGQSPAFGYILTASDSSGDAAWTSAGQISGWTISGNNVYETSSGNVGIGTTTVNQGSLVVTNGNVGIGTWTTAGGTLIVASGNVGIGSVWPGQALDVQGTVRSTGLITNGSYTQIGTSPNSFTGTPTFSNVTTSALFTGGNVGIGSTAPGQLLDVLGTVRMSGLNIPTGAASTKVLTSDAFGNATWQPVSGSGTVNTGNVNRLAVYATTGTTLSDQTVIYDDGTNIGIGTAGPSSLLDVNRKFNVLASGNVGIGSLTPGQSLDVKGTVRMTGITMSGFSPISGYVLTASDSAGDTTWTSPGASSGWTISGNNVYETSSGNVGIGTTTVNQGALVVTNGNVGIGTWTTAGGNLIVNGGGNVGIGTAWPGTVMDVNGTVRMTGFMLNSNPVSGDILMTNSIGIGTWVPASSVATPTPPGGTGTELQYRNGTSFGAVSNSAVNTNGNVGLGTTLSTNKLDVQGGVGIGTAYAGYFAAPSNGLIVQGNVGIGSTAPGQMLDVQGTVRNLGEIVNGNVGIGTFANQAALAVVKGNVGIGTWTAAGGNLIVNGGGNVGIGSAWPGQMLDVQGTVRAMSFSMSGYAPISGYVMTASDSAGDTTWTSAGAVSGWTVSGNNVYETSSGNVGIGTTTITQGALVVTNGNVGIGTWTTAGGNLIVNGGGNVGIGTAWPGTAMDVNGTLRATSISETGDIASGPGATSLGFAQLGGTITAGTGGLAGGEVIQAAGSAAITSSGTGDFAYGFVQNVGGSNSITSSGFGSIAMGYGNSGTITSSGAGSIAMGYSNFGILQATGQGSVAIGESVQANAVDALAFGSSVINNTASTFMVGFNPTPTLTVTSANVGIGTFNPFGGKLIVASGNVGIGSLSPGQMIDVQGTVRALGLAVSGASPISGYVLTASDSAGDTTWTPAGYFNGWTAVGNNVYETSSGNVGIGTTTITQGALVVTNGNVGIGTWTTAGGNLIVNGGGNVGIGSAWPGQALDVNGTVRSNGFATNGSYTQSGTSPNTFTGTPTFSNATNSALFTGGNVGIGSTAPGQLLDIQGTLRALGETINGNVGIGTFASQTALAVTRGNVGIGTWTAAGGNLIVNGGGNVGIGSAWPGQALDVQGTVRSTGFLTNGGYIQSGISTNIFTGNVGISSTAPGQMLDIQGTVRSLGITMSSQSPISGYVLTASDSAGDTTWTPAGYFNGWTAVGNNVYETSSGNVGIGTTTITQGALVVTNGNVGIGTWTTAGGNLIVNGGGNVGIGSAWPGQMLDIQGSLRALGEIVNGNVGIGTSASQTALAVTRGNVGIGTWTAAGGSLIVSTGNVGIGSAWPGQALDVQGTVRSTGFLTNGGYVQSGLLTNTFTGNVGITSTAPGQMLDIQGTVRSLGITMTGQSPISGYVLTASDSAGDTTWTPAGYFNGWTAVGNNVYETSSGNVGIGTTTITQGALVVTNGNVGIGTWTTAGGNLIVNGGGNVGIGSAWPGQALDVQGTIRSTGYIANGGYTQIGTSPNSFTGTPTFSNATFSALFTGGNVGIGSTAPGQLLDIQGTLRALGETINGNVGIGTYASQTALAVTRGNVGIGTWTAAGGSLIVSTGNVGIGSAWPGQALDVQGTVRSTGFLTNGGYVQSGTSTNTLTGVTTFTANVGISSTAPGQMLDIQGTVRSLGITMTGQSPISGYVLTASDSAGDTTWTPAGYFNGWTAVGNNVYETSSGNVGIGTTTITQGALVVTNGNVGIGTWTTAGGNLIVNGGGNVGIGSAWPGQMLDIQGTLRALGEIVNGKVGIGTWAPGSSLEIAVGNIGIGTQYSLVGIGTTSILTLRSDSTSIYVGIQAGTSTTAGTLNNVAMGYQSLNQNSTGSDNTAVGYQTLISNTKSFNSAMGYQALNRNTTGQYNSAMGMQSLIFNISGSYNSAMGVSALSSNTFGNYNSAVGASALNNLTGNYSDNTALGYNAAYYITGGATYLTSTTQSTFLGDYTMAQANGDTNEIVVGYNATGNGSNSVTLGNTSVLTTVLQGNIGIGTFNPFGGKLIVTGGNVGIGSLSPGQMLDIQGTVRSLGITMTGQSPISGYVLTASDSAGDTTWTPAGYFNGWTAVGNNVYETSSGNVGIGTTTITQGALVVTNGNVGIGTWTTAGGNLIVNGGGNVGIGSAWPGQMLDIQGTLRALGETINGNVGIGTSASQTALAVTRGNVGIGTWTAAGGSLIVASGNVGIGSAWPGQMLDVQGTVRSAGFLTNGSYIQSGLLPNTFTGNVGISSTAPGQMLDIQGTVRSLGITMTGQSPISGYVLTASDSTGDTTWTPAGYFNGWTAVGNNVYETSSGNVGIGTTTITQGALVVTNGNVGIGTWTTAGGSLIIKGSGNVGIGTAWPGTMLDVQGTIRFSQNLEQGGAVASGAFNSTALGYVSGGGTIISSGSGSIAAGASELLGGTSTSIISNAIGSIAQGAVVASGSNATLSATSSGAVALGVSDATVSPTLLTAGGSGSFAEGIALNGTLQATGLGSIAMGENVQANGSSNSIAIGNGVINNSTSTFMVGFNTNPTLTVTSANVGIGTFNPFGGGLIVTNGNVGIGSLSPGQMLDVQGTVRSLGLAVSGASPISGYVLTASDSAGDTTWTPAGYFNGWTAVGNNVYETSSGNVGIGTTSITQGALLVTNGNVGIGTWTTAGGNLIVNGGGNVGIGSVWPGQSLDVQGTARMSGNVGIGSSITDSGGSPRLTITSSSVEVNLQ